MYKHLFEVRSRLEQKLQFFLAINTLFIFCFLELFNEEISNLSLIHLTPFILLIVPILFILTSFISTPGRIPWFNQKDFMSYLREKEFSLRWLSEIFASANATNLYQKRMVYLLNTCLGLVAVSICWMTALFVIELCSSNTLIGLKILMLSLIGGTLIGICYLICQNLRPSNHKAMEKEFFDIFSKFLKENPSK